ncbi:hypothetical protein L686_12205 [Stutzerimonas stutzeri MF28]|nr:hypothetical protein L686_12205 [Stutzerimonas stutzeri MF28]
MTAILYVSNHAAQGDGDDGSLASAQPGRSTWLSFAVETAPTGGGVRSAIVGAVLTAILYAFNHAAQGEWRQGIAS